VSIQALIGDTANRRDRVQNVLKEETIAEGNKFRDRLAFEIVG
jgi:hypothetical protein